MILQRTPVRRVNLQRAKIYQLMNFLGAPQNLVYGKRKYEITRGRAPRTFWKRYEDQLHAILRDARGYFIKSMKEAHPDTGKRSERHAADITFAWQRIKHLFKQRGVTLE